MKLIVDKFEINVYRPNANLIVHKWEIALKGRYFLTVKKGWAFGEKRAVKKALKVIDSMEMHLKIFKTFND